MNMAEKGSSDLAFREPSSGGIDLNVNITQQSRDYSEHFACTSFGILCVLHFQELLIQRYLLAIY